MNCEYTLPLVAICPVDGVTVDAYRVTVRTDRMVRVEELLLVLKRFEHAVIFQEDLTAKLAAELGAEVETLGRHSGVETRCVCGGDR